jgi:hypothetical protein
MARESSNPTRYEPEPLTFVVPDMPSLSAYVQRELARVSIALQTLADGQMEEVTSAPAKPRHGMIRLADGTSWNPGFGRGVYWYDKNTATWKFLG